MLMVFKAAAYSRKLAKGWFFIVAILLTSQQSLADNLLFRFETLQRAHVPALFLTPDGEKISLTSIKQSLIKLPFKPGDSISYDTATESVQVYYDQTPYEVLTTARVFINLDLDENIAAILPENQWFTDGISVTEVNAIGTTVFAPDFTYSPIRHGEVGDTDLDGDGLIGDEDNCPNSPNPNQLDTDGDLVGDACDADADNDGVLNQNDLAPLNPKSCIDEDLDQCDDCSVGADGFGILIDNLVDNDGPDQDSDGICDLGDPDIDGDEVLNQDDNCPMVANPLQEDEDDNNEGDVCVSLSDGELFCLPLVSENGNVSVVCL